MKLAIGLLLAAGLGAADLTMGGDNGNVLLESCELASRGAGRDNQAEALQSGFCLGLIEGIADTLAVARMAKWTNAYCPPKGLTPMERIHGVLRYLREHKAELANKPRSYWGFMALVELYPCGK